MSIKPQADFWLKNVCDFNMKNQNLPKETTDGFIAFSDLLRSIYEDYSSFEVSKKSNDITKIGIAENDLENYHNLTETVDCLYKIAALGELDALGEEVFLRVDKALFKTKFKKPTPFVFSMLEKYGFYFIFYKGDNEVDEYKKCNIFCFYYENSNHLISAINLLAKTLAKQCVKTDLSNGISFYMADYDSILGDSKATPDKQSITTLLGDYSTYWLAFIKNIKPLGYNVELSINPYVFPNWTAKILNGKKTVCTFHINCDKLLIRLPLSFDTAKKLILSRDALPKSINNCISNWHCVNCGKCQNQSNIQLVNDIPICTLKYSNFCTEDSRMLSFEITQRSKIEILNDIILGLI